MAEERAKRGGGFRRILGIFLLLVIAGGAL